MFISNDTKLIKASYFYLLHATDKKQMEECSYLLETSKLDFYLIKNNLALVLLGHEPKTMIIKQ